MSRLIIRLRKTPEIRWQGVDLLQHESPLARKLFDHLLRYRNGVVVSGTELNELNSSNRVAWQQLCAAVSEKSSSPRGSIYTISLPSGATEHEALLLLKKVSKSDYLLRIRDDTPDVSVDIWNETSGTVLRRLPPYPNRFIGRETEIEHSVKILGNSSEAFPTVPVRLLTVTGPPGCGKTRFGVELAKHISGTSEYSHVYFIPFASYGGYESVSSFTCRVLGVREVPGQKPVRTLKEWIGENRVLLLLDNCDGYLDSCAKLVNVLLEECPNLQILATSLEQLPVNGAVQMPLKPLASPPIGIVRNRETLETYSAPKLFLDHVTSRRIASDTFLLSGTDTARWENIATLCRRLDGLPLALEIAAGLESTFTVEEILQRLDGQFGIFQRHYATEVPHHQSLSTLLSWAYELLDEPGQTLLQRLSIFIGPVSLATVEAVCEDADLPLSVLDNALAVLVNKSLIVPEKDRHVTLFHLLETIRLYAKEQLRKRGDERVAQNRMATYYEQQIEALVQAYHGLDEKIHVQQIATEYENISYLLHQYLRLPPSVQAKAEYSEQTEYSDPYLRHLTIASSLWRFWVLQGRCQEGRELLLQLLAKQSGSAAVDHKEAIAFAYVRLSNLSRELGLFTEAVTEAVQSLEIFQTLKHPYGCGAALHCQATALWNLGKYEEAEPLYKDSLNCWVAMGDKVRASFTLNNLGTLYFRLGRFDKAIEHHERSLALKEENHDTWGIATSLINLGQTALYQRHLDRARNYLNKASVLMEGLDDKKGDALVQMNLGSVELAAGNYTAALVLLEQALSGMQAVNDLANVASIRSEMGLAYHRIGDSVEGIRRLIESIVQAEQLRDISGVLGTMEYLLLVCAESARWSEVAWLTGITDHYRLTHRQPDILFGRNERLAAQVEARATLGNDSFMTSYNEGVKQVETDDLVLNIASRLNLSP